MFLSGLFILRLCVTYLSFHINRGLYILGVLISVLFFFLFLFHFTLGDQPSSSWLPLRHWDFILSFAIFMLPISVLVWRFEIVSFYACCIGIYLKITATVRG
jgi:hypothetical protein